ncbi:cardiolipin synthase (CMP-forming) isoform X2 [Papio anubis]|uniref:cardiolipin synthase (CMP-forming) isoform X2 n=1 Tax=Papio anubis TaxID=9555 RepID=UPI0012AD2392|nr:cardiolipin synthase (CMP-forming) isoform X2 [Papio anubis]XP_045218469.1 cardiolipin synthase (CMP-forming) isoform X2 [Macaca fascicularis]
MLALRVARGSWGALRGAAWAPGTRPSKGRACWALLPPVPCCLGCLAERWRLRPAALGLRLPGIGQRNHCSGAGKAAPRPAAGAGAAAEAPGGQWGPASTPSLYENPWTIPNMLSMTRIGLAPVLGYLIIEEDFNIALGVFALAGLTDLVPRNANSLGPHRPPVPLTYMIISRDVMLIAAVFYVRYRTLPTPRTLAKYFNPCYATARLKPTFISKVNTAVQLILVAASLAAPVFNYADSIYLQILWCFTAFTTAASAYSYYHYGRKTVQVIKD